MPSKIIQTRTTTIFSGGSFILRSRKSSDARANAAIRFLRSQFASPVIAACGPGEGLENVVTLMHGTNMKTTLPVLAVAIALTVTLQTFGGDAATTKRPKPPNGAGKEKKQLLTG